MRVKREGFLTLLENNFQGNCSKCARTLNVAPSTVSRVINGENEGGIKLISKLMEYCKSNDVNSEDIIFFT